MFFEYHSIVLKTSPNDFWLSFDLNATLIRKPRAFYYFAPYSSEYESKIFLSNIFLVDVCQLSSR